MKSSITQFFIDIFVPFFLDLIFPRGEIIERIEKISAREALSTLPLCQDKTGLISEMRDMTVVFKYRNRMVRQMIWELKYRGNKKIARLCGEILLEVILRGESGSGENFSLPIVLIPVPLSRERRRERGFNQNELVIKEIVKIDSKKIGNKDFSFSFDALQKIRHTLPQSSIKNRVKRMENLKDCFVVSQPESVRRKNIVLIDDVVTTGSTLREVREALLKADARSVHAIAIAH